MWAIATNSWQNVIRPAGKYCFVSVVSTQKNGKYLIVVDILNWYYTVTFQKIWNSFDACKRMKNRIVLLECGCHLAMWHNLEKMSGWVEAKMKEWNMPMPRAWKRKLRITVVTRICWMKNASRVKEEEVNGIVVSKRACGRPTLSGSCISSLPSYSTGSVVNPSTKSALLIVRIYLSIRYPDLTKFAELLYSEHFYPVSRLPRAQVPDMYLNCVTKNIAWEENRA